MAAMSSLTMPIGGGESQAPSDASTQEGSLRVTVQQHGTRVLVIEVDGTLDSVDEPLFADPIRRGLSADVEAVVLDLSAVSRLSTAGAVALLEAAYRAQLRRVGLVMVSSRAVHELLELLDIADHFTYAPTVELAVQHGRTQTGP